MKNYALNMLAKRIVSVAPLCALVFSPAAFSQQKVLTRKSLEITLEEAVKCKNEALFSVGWMDPNTDDEDPKPSFRALGVEVTADVSSTLTKINYKFPRGVKVFGYEAREAKFFEGPTFIFYITLRTGSDNLRGINKTLRLRPASSHDQYHYGLFNEIDVRYIRKLSDDKDIPPDTILSGTVHQGNDIVIGCQNLAW